MPKLSRYGPAFAAPGLLAVPDEAEEGGETVYPAVALARQIMVEGGADQDLESLLIPATGDGPPPTDGSVVSILYRDTTNDRSYMRIDSDPLTYVPV